MGKFQNFQEITARHAENNFSGEGILGRYALSIKEEVTSKNFILSELKINLEPERSEMKKGVSPILFPLLDSRPKEWRTNEIIASFYCFSLQLQCKRWRNYQ